LARGPGRGPRGFRCGRARPGQRIGEALVSLSTADFLLEIGVEELPTPYVVPALTQLERELREALGEMRLGFSECVTFATPRRLAVLFTEVVTRQADYEEEAHGPAVAQAFDADGNPTKALLGFVRGRGVDVADVRRVRKDKGEYVAVTIKREGKSARELLPAAITRVTGQLAFPKSMRWLDSDFRFARPIRWIVALLGDETLDFELAGLRAGRASRGHRFLHPGPVSIPHPTGYVEALAAAGVVADPRLRREVILEQASALAKEAGGRLVDDPELIEINNFLVERPQALLGRFETKYLDLPREVIVTALREHQRYFAVEKEDGALVPAFVALRNGDDRNLATIAHGNAAVLRARLDDARFYWDTDLRKAPADRVEELRGIVWLEGLGTVRDKVERVRRLGAWIAGQWDPDLMPVVDRAALLAKTDLLSEMIGSGKEYASLEGVMGSHYAERHGEPKAVVSAIRDHVKPRGAGDALPASAAGAILALADRADSVVGCYLADKGPSGGEDPYGVRRAGNGVVRILLEQERHLDVSALTSNALAGYEAAGEARAAGAGSPARAALHEVRARIDEFWEGRIESALEDRGYAYDEIAASLGGTDGGTDPMDVERRAGALKRRRTNEDFRPLVIGFKRVANILRAADPNDVPAAVVGDLPDPHEAALASAIAAATREAEPLFEKRDYDAVLGVLLRLRGPIDTFFEEVMVNVPETDVRRRRLGVLSTARALFDRAWDLSRVVVET
ncbi:MAG: glycine--tRNA ligase subunit beta, partial [Candidatus Eiseniibacteriota bacterium]